MCKKLNNYFFKKLAQKYLSITSRERRYVSYNKAKTILLLFESDYLEKNPHVRKMISTLQQDGKKVVAWGFVNKKDIASAILPDFRILNHKQTTFFHKPTISCVKELQDMKFDLMIDLSLTQFLPLDYLAMYANASFKTGVKKTELPIYDFILDLENFQTTSESSENPVDEMFLFDQIIFYLKSIQTND